MPKTKILIFKRTLRPRFSLTRRRSLDGLTVKKRVFLASFRRLYSFETARTFRKIRALSRLRVERFRFNTIKKKQGLIKRHIAYKDARHAWKRGLDLRRERPRLFRQVKKKDWNLRSLEAVCRDWLGAPRRGREPLFRFNRKSLLAFSVLVVFVFGVAVFPFTSQGATYTFTQTDWSGGTSVTTATHASNQSGWDKYASKDANVVTSTVGQVTLSQTSVSTTQTSSTDFGTGTNSSTEVSGTGDSALVQLFSGGTVAAVSNGGDHTCAVKSDGTVYCWGRNALGQLGDNTTTQRNTPVQVLGVGASGNLTGVSQVSAGETHTCAVKSDGTVYCWGNNGNGQLGDNTATQRNTPVQVKGVGGTGNLTGVSQVSAGDSHTCAMKSDGTAYCWGYNDFGQVGDNGTSWQRLTPVQVLGVGGTGNLTGVSQVSAGMYHTCALKSDGTAYCWGDNTNGQLGDNTITRRLTPVQVLGVGGTGNLTGVSQVSAAMYFNTCALKSDGTAYCWGINSSGQLGDNTTTQRNTPVQVLGVGASGNLTGVSQISAGRASPCALKSDGAAYCWGFNTGGALGDNTTSQRNTPVQVLGVGASGNLTGVSQISGDNHTCAVKSDGTAYCWGYNALGQLGDNTATQRNTPVQVLGVGASGNLWLIAYASSGTFTSGTVDLGQPSNFSTLSFTASTPVSTTLQIQIAANTDNATWNYIGPDGTSGTYFTSGNTIPSALNGSRYVRYQLSFATSDTTATASFSDITVNSTYFGTGTLTSSVFDASDAANLMYRVQWTETLPLGGMDIRFQIRTSADNVTWTGWQGTDGTSGTYFTDASGGESMPGGLADATSDRYFQYKVELVANTYQTPTLSDAAVTYVVNAAPEVQTVSATQGSNGDVTITYEVRDIDTSTAPSPGSVTVSLEYCSANCGSAGSETWTSAATVSGNVGAGIAVAEGSFNSYSITWNPNTDYDNQYVSNMKVRVSANDGELANNVGRATSAAFALDTKAPTLGAAPILINASVVPATATLSATDDSTLSMKVGLNADLSGASYEAYNSTKTITLATNPDTVYAQFRDGNGNESAIVSVTSPNTPTLMMVQDISNIPTTEYRLFVSWQVVTEPAAGFASYQVYRSTDNSTYTLLATVSSRLVNYHIDTTPAFDTAYYYKVKTVDVNNNSSVFSSALTGKANGTQDSGEGGGGSETTPPVISSVSTTAVSTTQATILWDTDELSSSTVGFSTMATVFVDEIGVANYTDNAAGTGRHQVVLSGLTPNTTYYYQVKSTDPTGNISTDSSGGNGYSFTTLDGPAISGVSLSSTANTQATITWNTDIAASSTVNYSASVSGGALVSPLQAGDATLATAHSVTLTGLTTGTEYFFSVSSTDGDSNIAVDNNAGDFYSFTTTSDTAGPVITDPTAAVRTYSTAVITWVTNEQANSQVRYAATAGGPYTNTTATATYGENHHVILTGLAADTTYYYRVVSADLSSNSTTTSEASFTTLKNPEYQHDPLAEITGILESLVTDTSAYISFVSDQPALCTVNYGALTGTYTASAVETAYNENHAIKLSTLTPSTLYYYQVSCVDNLSTTVTAAEENFLTDVLQVDSGSETGDVDEPEITSVSVGSITGESAIVSWKTDEDANGLVSYGPETDLNQYGKAVADVTINSDKDNFTTEHSITLANLVPGTKYYYYATSYDKKGNMAQSSQSSFTTKSPSTISSINILSEKIGEAILTWKTSEAMSSIVEYGLKETYGDKQESSNTKKEHRLTITRLESNKTYHFRVRGKDADGNLYSSSDYTFVPRSLPEIRSAEVKVLSDTEVEVSFSSTTPTDALVTYAGKNDEKESGSQGRPELAVRHVLTLKNLEPGTAYTGKIQARDEAGNEVTEELKDFTTTEDKNAPLIDQLKTDMALAQDGKVQAIISWFTNEPASTRLSYKEGAGGEEKTLASKDELNVAHVVVGTVFKPGSVYYLKARSRDKSGNETVSKERMILTPQRSENIVQVIVTNFKDIFSWAAPK